MKKKNPTAKQQIKAAQEQCPVCNGSGKVPGKITADNIIEKRCPLCKGTGKVKPKKRGNKYGTSPKAERTYKGVVYHSKLEARVAQWLDWRLVNNYSLRAGEKMKYSGGDVLSWERQVKFLLWASHVEEFVNDETWPVGEQAKKVGTYTIDFKVEYTNGEAEYLEVKGAWTPLAKLKFTIFRANHPELNVRIITEKELPKGF